MISEAPRSSLRDHNFIIFLGSIHPDPPSLGMLPHAVISPSEKKILFSSLYLFLHALALYILTAVMYS